MTMFGGGWHDMQPFWTNQSAQQSFHAFGRRDPFKEPITETHLPGPKVNQYTTWRFASKAHSGPDGKVMSERYASSSAGNGRNKIHEARHLYTDSSGLEKSSHEQHIGGRSRMLVTETQKGNQSKSSQVFHGMDEAEVKAFDQDFASNVANLPHRAELGQDALEPPFKNDLHNWPRPSLRGSRQRPANMFDHDFWAHHDVALPPGHDEEDDHTFWRGFWPSPSSTHGVFLPFSNGNRHRIGIA